MTRTLLAALFLLAASAAWADPQSTAFTYQGNLTSNGSPANGNFNLTFTLYGSPTGSDQVGSPLSMPSFPVVNGRFTTDLDFPGTFSGQQRWLQVKVGTQLLSPRQPVNAVPVAQYALTSTISSGSITNDSLANGSVTLSKLKGGSTTGNISFSLGANSCGTLNISVSGATVGDLPLLAFSGSTLPGSIMFGPPTVGAANTVQVRACNVSANPYSGSGLPVIIKTIRP
jgi:hypothetical protein